MHRRMVSFVLWVLVFLCASTASLRAQEFKLFDREVQVHGWLSQGFVYTNDNNWLTMNTSSGSGAMTDMGLNLSSQLTDKFRVSAQVFDRNLGQLGQWHPLLDYAVADYRFTSWFGIRGGKVKTVLGLYNDSQDQDFLHPFALLPQSIYPTDLREATIAHLGGDIYGSIPLGRNRGDLSYTTYAGHRQDSLHGGYPYLVAQEGLLLSSYGGLQYGGDLRWNTPFTGLLLGVSRLNEDLNIRGTNFFPLRPFSDSTNSDWTNQFYGRYAFRRLEIYAEYRRNWQDHTSLVANVPFRFQNDIRGWYAAATYRVDKRLQFGTYYSQYLPASPLYLFLGVPSGHIYDKVVTANVDTNRLLNVKVEGHFMNGYGGYAIYPSGFYPQVNPNGFANDTNALVLKTSFHF
jgi:hypothetical protein